MELLPFILTIFFSMVTVFISGWSIGYTMGSRR